MDQRYCVINPAGGPIAIRLSANNALRASGSFAIQTSVNGNWQDVEQWQQAAGNAGNSDHQLQTPTSSMDGKSFVGKVNCCAMLPNANMGSVEMQVIQDGVSCPLTKPMHWNLSDVPTCESGNGTSFKTSLIFLTHNP